ncbi:hypothetical protein KC352_g34105, partial [Hortaea werneckii]
MSYNQYSGYGGNPYGEQGGYGGSNPYASDGGNPYGGGGGGYGQSPYGQPAQSSYGAPPQMQHQPSNYSQTADSTYSQQQGAPAGAPPMPGQQQQQPHVPGQPIQPGQNVQYVQPAPSVLSNQDFLSRVEAVKADIRTLTTHVGQIASLHQRALSSPDSGAGQSLESMITQTQVLNTSIKDQIKFLET